MLIFSAKNKSGMIKKLHHLITFILFIVPAHFYAQPPNDFQCTPNIIGMLPNAPFCAPGGPSFNLGSSLSASGTTIGATNDSLSGAITSCYSGTAPLKDVWFEFTASETHAIVMIKGVGATPLQNAYIGLYEALTNECVGLMPRQCKISSGVALDTFDFGPLTWGVKYYIQVASMTAAGAGNFTLSVRSKNICSDCLKNSLLLAYPLPVQAAYAPDTTVGFCYSVVAYNEHYGNRFHGIVPLFGSGWDSPTFNVISLPNSSDGAGQWQWFSNILINGSNESGFFYDVGADNDPTNNLGDQSPTPHIWTFCFTVKTQTQTFCNTLSNDLSIRFINYSDGESGSLVTPQDCSGDADYVFDAHMNCCQKPLFAYSTSASCSASGDGTIDAYGGSFSIFGYTYDLFNSSGLQIDNFTSTSTAYTNDSLDPGNYYLYITDIANNCQSAVNVLVNGPLIYSISQTAFGCGGAPCTNSATVNIDGGNISTITWNGGAGGTGLTGINLCPGWNYVTMVDTGIVACTIQDSIFIINTPAGNYNFNYDQVNYCTSDSFAIVSGFPTATGGTFSIVAGPAGNPIDPSTGTITLTSPGSVVVKYSTSAPCPGSSFDTILISSSLPPVSLPGYSDKVICYEDPNPAFSNPSGGNLITWFDEFGTTLGSQPGGTFFDPFLGIQPSPGSYNFHMTQSGSPTATCQSVPLYISVNVFNPPLVDAGPNVSVCPGFGIRLQASGANSYTWYPPMTLDNATVPDPLASPIETTLYYTVGTDAASGCSSSDSVFVFIDSISGCDVIVYSGFTPNGDNKNDFWYIDGIVNDDKNMVSIFNRWGEKIWERKNYDNLTVRWDGYNHKGEILPDGTYYYLINFKDKQLKGWVELTR
jgi:gliding motility-associated-like protein